MLVSSATQQKKAVLLQPASSFFIMQATRLQLEELQRKLRLEANTRASDAPGHGHAQQAPLEGQEATAPSQLALGADSKGPHGAGNASAVATSSRDIPPELPRARAAPSSPDISKQVNAKGATVSSLKLQQAEGKAVSKRPQSAEQLGTKRAPASALAFKQASKQQPSLVAAPSTAHISTAPQVAAESPEQPGDSVWGAAAAKQSRNNPQQAQAACTRGLELTTLPGAAESSVHAVSNQAATQEASVQPLLGMSPVTPLPPPVLSPTGAVPNALTAAAQSPNGSPSERGQNQLLGRTAVPAQPSIPSPTAAQSQASPAHQISSSPASSPPALTASDVGQQPSHASPQPAQASALPAQASPLPAQASALPHCTLALSAQASPPLAQASPLPCALPSLHTTAGDAAQLPQQVPVATPLQSLSISMAAVPSGSVKEATAHRDDHDTDLPEVGTSGKAESSGAVDAQGATSQPVADGGFFVFLHGSCRKLGAEKGSEAASRERADQTGRRGGSICAETPLLSSCLSPG